MIEGANDLWRIQCLIVESFCPKIIFANFWEVGVTHRWLSNQLESKPTELGFFRFIGGSVRRRFSE